MGWCKSNSRTGNLLLFYSALLLKPLSGQTPPHIHFRLYPSITWNVVIPNFQRQNTSKTISPLFCKASSECWWDTASRVGGFPAQLCKMPPNCKSSQLSQLLLVCQQAVSCIQPVGTPGMFLDVPPKFRQHLRPLLSLFSPHMCRASWFAVRKGGQKS